MDSQLSLAHDFKTI